MGGGGGSGQRYYLVLAVLVSLYGLGGFHHIGFYCGFLSYTFRILDYNSDRAYSYSLKNTLFEHLGIFTSLLEV